MPDAKTICSFTNDNHIIGKGESEIVISMEGNYYLAHFDEKNGGECKKVLEKKLVDKPDI